MPYSDAIIFDCNNEQQLKLFWLGLEYKDWATGLDHLYMLIDRNCVAISSHESIWNTAFKLCLNRIECCWFACTSWCWNVFWVGPGVAAFSMHFPIYLMCCACEFQLHIHCFFPTVSTCLISSVIAIHGDCHIKFQKRSGDDAKVTRDQKWRIFFPCKWSHLNLERSICFEHIVWSHYTTWLSF